MKRLQGIARNVLLAFVLITIGFALGKEAARRQTAAETAQSGRSVTNVVTNAAVQTKVIVYYAHTTFRCLTCNTIEDLAQRTVKTRFADAIAAGTLEWRVVDFQEDDTFARRYEIVSSCLVVVGMRGNHETGHRRLDEIWTKVSDPTAFDEYVASAVREFLMGKEEGEQ